MEITLFIGKTAFNTPVARIFCEILAKHGN